MNFHVLLLLGAINKKHFAFTLIELLVVITIIGMLMALLTSRKKLNFFKRFC